MYSAYHTTASTFRTQWTEAQAESDNSGLSNGTYNTYAFVSVWQPLTLVVLETIASLRLFPIKELLQVQRLLMLLSVVMIVTTIINLVLLVPTCQEIDLIQVGLWNSVDRPAQFGGRASLFQGDGY